MATRWGIAGAGKICNDFVLALQALPSSEHVVVAVASASGKDGAVAFAKKHKIPTAYGSYEELAKNKEIDIVYVGSLLPQHFSNTKLFFDHGKPVLCEKPLCRNYKETETLIKMAKQKNLFLMEAVWSRCFPVYNELRKHIAAGTIGDICYVQSSLGLQIDENDRILTKPGGGTILDFGVYTLQLVVLIFGQEKPTSLKAVGYVNKEGVDKGASCVMTFSGNRTAVVSTHSSVELPNKAYIVGTKGTIEIDKPFWNSPTMKILGEEKAFPLPSVEGKFNYFNSVGLHYEAAEVRRCLLQGLKESPKAPHADSLAIAHLEDGIRNEIGAILG